MSVLSNFSTMTCRAVAASLRRLWTSSGNAPFLPVLIGDATSCRVVWAEASGDVNATCCLALSAETPVLDGCVAMLLSSVNLYERSLAVLSDALDLSQDHLGRKIEGLSRAQIVAFFEHSANPGTSLQAFVCSCCLYSRALCSEDSARLLQSLRSESNPVIADSSLLATLFDLAGDEWSLPILCELDSYEFPGGKDSVKLPASGDVVAQLRTIVSASLESDRVRMGLAMSAADYDRLLTEAQSTFLTSPLRENVFVLTTAESSRGSAPISNPGLAESGSLIDHVTESIIRLQLQRALPAVKDPSELLQKAMATSAAIENGQHVDARSMAESFLFDLLNAHPETTGLFSLNPKMDFHFGGRPAEIDLCSRELQIAIEVDGHYHFSDLAAYRRDRRKDLVLQREGFFVVRVLAEDVVPRMDEVLQTVINVVRWRTSSARSSKVLPSRSIEKGAIHEY